MAMGRKTTTVVAVEAITALVTSSAPLMTRSRKEVPSRFRVDLKQLSITTMELSTSIPMPITRPPRDIMLMVIPIKAMIIRAVSTERGMEMATMAEAFHSPKKSQRTRTAMARPSTRLRTTCLMFSIISSPLL